MKDRHPAQYYVKNRSLWVLPLQDLDHHNVDQIRGRIDNLMEECNIDELIFDFSQVEFMDSAGIGMIMGRYRKLLLQKGRLRAVGLHPSVQRILKYSGLYQIMEVCEECSK